MSQRESDIPRIVSPARQSPRLQERAQRILRKRAQQRRDFAAIPEGKEEEKDKDDPPPDDVSALSDESFEEQDIMSSNQPKGILKKMLGEAFMAPVSSLNVTQAQAIRQTISNVMSTIMDYRHDGGYSWLIEEEGNYKLRLSITDDNFTMPELPAMPAYNENANREQMGHYNIKMTQYQSGRFWNSEILDVLQEKIPGALTAVEIHPGILPANYTARDAIDHIIANVKSETAATHSLRALTQELLDLSYTPNANGATQYFSEAMQIQEQIRELDSGSAIADKIVMNYATDAFL